MIRTLVSHSLVYGLTNIAARASLFVSLLVLPTILEPVDYGALAMLTLVGNLAAIVVPMQVAQGLARHHGVAGSEAEKDLYSSTAWWFTVFASLTFFAAGQAAAPWATHLILGDEIYTPVLRIALAVMFLNTLFFFLQSQFRWSFRPGDFVIVSLTYSVLTLGLSVGLALAAPLPLEGVVIGQAIGAGIAVIWGMWRLWSRFTSPFDQVRLREMLGFGGPLVPAALSVAIIVYAARIALNDSGSLSDVGVFAFASQIAAIATLAIVGLQAAMTPLVTAHYREPETPAALGRVFEAFSAAALVICLMLGLFAPEAIAWYDHPEYSRAGPLVMVMAPALVIAEMYIFAPGFWIAKRTGLQALVSVIAALAALAAAYLLIGRLGLLGATLATLASSTFFFALWWIVSGRFYRIPVRWTRLALYVAAAGGAGACAMYLTEPGTTSALAAKSLALLTAAVLAVATGLVPLREAMVAARKLAAPRAPSSSGPSV